MSFQIIFIAVFLAVLELQAAGYSITGINNFNGMINGNYYGGNNVNSHYYHMNNYQYKIDGSCIRKLTIIGRGVDDTFEEPCSNQTPSTFLDSNFLIVGDPDRSKLCLFTDAHAKLVIIRNGKCNLRTYKTEIDQTTKVESLMDDGLCSEVKRKISEEQEKNRIYWEQWQRKFDARMRKAFPPGFPFHKTNKQESSSSSSSEENTKKTPYINLLNGVTHSASPPTMNSPTNFDLVPQPLTPSTAINMSPPSSPILPSTETMNTPTHFNLMPQSLSPSTAINVSPPSSPAMQSTGISSTTKPNDQIAGNANSLFNSGFNLETSFPDTNEKVKCQVKISVVGNSVSDSFIEPCSDSDVDLIIKDRILMFGNPKKDSFCLYSKEAGTLVVIKNKICIKKVYSTVKGITNSKKVPFTISKCTALKRTLSNEIEKRKDKKSIKMNPAAPSLDQPTIQGTLIFPGAEDLINKPTYGMHTKYNYGDECQRDIQVLGKGINDRFLTSCPENDTPLSITNNNILLLTDLLGDLELFSDTWATLIVIQNGECTRRTYSTTNGQTEITPNSMSEEECSEVQEKMAEYV